MSAYRLIPTAAVLGLIAAAAHAQSTQPAFPYEGEVTGDDVYVRSGPGVNYYPTTKLKTGQHIRVLGEQFGWLRIAPPSGSFSYIDMSFVEKKDAQRGIVTGDNVLVRAGSTLSTRKNEVQTKLHKGDTVTIQGEADGFYKILPPKDACLWISSQYVRPLDGGPAMTTQPAATRAAATRPGTPGSQPGDADIVASLAEETSVARDEPPKTSPPAAAPATTQPAEGEGTRVTVRTGRGRAAERIAQYLQESGPRGVRVQQLEDELRGLLDAATSADTAALERLMHEYETIAAQDDEPIAQAVARARVRQINSRIELLGSRTRMLDEQKDLEIYRRQLGEDRSRIGLRTSAASQPGYDFKGELRASPLFTESQRRYRLVNPADGGRTIAYVDLPVELSGNIPQWVGQYVGVRARSRVFDAALRLPVVVAEWIDVVDPKTGVPASAPATQADD